LSRGDRARAEPGARAFELRDDLPERLASCDASAEGRSRRRDDSAPRRAPRHTTRNHDTTCMTGDAAAPTPSMSDPTSRSRQICIKNTMGLHARPAALFVQIASKHEGGEIFVARLDEGTEEEVVNGKSIMGLMMLAAGQGTVLELRATGERAEDILRDLCELIERRFDEE
jgi:phosphocarrier protein